MQSNHSQLQEQTCFNTNLVHCLQLTQVSSMATIGLHALSTMELLFDQSPPCPDYFLGTSSKNLQEETATDWCIKTADSWVGYGYVLKNSKMVSDPEDEQIANIDDNNVDDPLLHCPYIAAELFDYFRRTESETRPRPDYMTRVQRIITQKTRANCVDWLAGIAEDLDILEDTLHMAINYLDRYLSEKSVDHIMLCHVGITCLMLAVKYDEEERRPGFDVFFRLTGDMISKKKFIELEWSVLSTLSFDLTPPTTHHFLLRYLHAAQGGTKNPIQSLEPMAFYLAELSLVSYEMIKFPPSMVAAAAVFFARYILAPTRKPWNATLEHYSYYKPEQIRNCVGILHRLGCESSAKTAAIRKKYTQVTYECVALITMPPTLPPEAFQR